MNLARRLNAVPSETPDPPYPPDIRAKGWRFELEPERVVTSDTWELAPPMVRPWLLMLWFSAWRQSPCGSLPNDDEIIAAKIGMDPMQFAGYRGVLMRGWFLASDGRLYHPTITELVLRMMDGRKGDRERQAAWRAKQKQALADDVTRDKRVSPPESAAGSGTGSGTGPGEKKAPRKRAALSVVLDAQHLVAIGVTQQHADEWLAVRKLKKLPLTQTVIDDLVSESQVAGLTVDEAVRTAVSHSWGGFKAKWLTNQSPVAGPAPRGKQSALEASNAEVARRWAQGAGNAGE